MLSTEVRDVASRIGHFYLEKNHGDYKETEIEIRRLGITKLVVEPDKITITLERPGLIIGKRGGNLDSLTKRLGKTVRIEEENDPLNAWLIPYPLEF